MREEIYEQVDGVNVLHKVIESHRVGSDIVISELNGDETELRTRTATPVERAQHEAEEARQQEAGVLAKAREAGFSKLKPDEQDELMALLVERLGA